MQIRVWNTSRMHKMTLHSKNTFNLLGQRTFRMGFLKMYWTIRHKTTEPDIRLQLHGLDAKADQFGFHSCALHKSMEELNTKTTNFVSTTSLSTGMSIHNLTNMILLISMWDKNIHFLSSNYNQFSTHLWSQVEI